MMDYETMDSSGAVVVLTSARPAGPRRLPVRSKRVVLDGEYDGWEATVRTNAPLGLFLKLAQLGQLGQPDDSNATMAALSELVNVLPALVLDWNFVDEDGQPLPCTRAGIERLPTDLLMALVGALSSATGDTAVPKN